MIKHGQYISRLESSDVNLGGGGVFSGVARIALWKDGEGVSSTLFI